MLNQIRHDHANMGRMLHVLQLKQRMLKEGERPNFHLMREVLDYIASYMSEFAVPLERIFLERLQQASPDHAKLAESMVKDYRELKPRLDRLSNDIDAILMDTPLPMDRFADDLKAYLDAHRAYLRKERENLFPLVEKHLGDADVDAMKQSLPEGSDKTLQHLQEIYPELYAELRDADVEMP